MAFFGYMAAKFTGITQYDNIITPLLVVAQCFCFFFGYIFLMTMASALLRDRRKIMLVSFLVVALFAVFAQILVFMGIFDIYSGFRKRLVERGSANAEQNGQG